jgi:hypothetical protein
VIDFIYLMEACDPLEHVNVYRRLPQQGSYWKILIIAIDIKSSSVFSDVCARVSLRAVKDKMCHYII